MRARTLILMAVLIFGGIGADWWMDEATDPANSEDVSKMDGPNDPPPTPHP